MDKLILENVRCFQERHELRLAPLTLIVGENSTGKSTLLAAARLAWDLGKGDLQPDFNEEPFDWGAYDQIAHYRRGRGGRAKTFALGFDANIGRPPWAKKTEAVSETVHFEATFVQGGAQPEIQRWKVQSGPYCIARTRKPTNGRVEVIVTAGPERRKFDLDPSQHALERERSEIAMLLGVGDPFSDHQRTVLNLLLLSSIFSLGRRPNAIAPIRVKPRRTYDRRSESQRPEGDHVPMVLAALKSTEPKQWEDLQSRLLDLGLDSGLFKGIDVKRLGNKESGPFQVKITISGPSNNLVDVGYGVSQVLPIAVDCLTSERGQLLLMQQPEVHLHPRAQAELGTFLGYLVKRRRNRFMIETHSDYLIDRVRLDIRDGKNLKPKDVSLLYCERQGAAVKVHEIEIDTQGNLVNVPPGYRRFFMEEEKRLFGG
jgi:predicted ATPase